MKKIIVIALFLLFFTLAIRHLMLNYRSGYKHIEYAKAHIKEQNFTRAQVHLSIAKKCNWGSCGNGIANANARIEFLESDILIQQNKYKEALKIIENISGCRLGDWCEERDSIKVSLLIKLNNKELLSRIINNQLKKEILNPSQYWDAGLSLNLKEIDYTLIIDIPWFNTKENDLVSIDSLTQGLSFRKLLN